MLSVEIISGNKRFRRLSEYLSYLNQMIFFGRNVTPNLFSQLFAFSYRGLINWSINFKNDESISEK